MVQYYSNKQKHTFNNNSAESSKLVCSFERFYAKQLEYVTKKHMAMYTII